MTPETKRFLDKATKLLQHAKIMLGVNLNEDAGRTAYLPGFHAAQGLIFEKSGKVLKTHKGVQIEFARLTKDEFQIPSEQRRFLTETYDLKALADYDTNPGSEVSGEQATMPLENAEQFLSLIVSLLDKHERERNP